MTPFLTKERAASAIVLAIVFALFAIFFYELAPASGDGAAASVIFEIKQGEGFRAIAGQLSGQGIIRSQVAFDLFALLGGRAFEVKPGLYRLDANMGAAEILGMITKGGAGQATVTIPEGSNRFEIDRILSNALVIHAGDLINLKNSADMEGKLFPDTYNFYTNASATDVAQELMSNFNSKAMPLLNADLAHFARNLTLASILEKEVASLSDQKIVAGILLKRLAAGMPLDVDATICYAKLVGNPTSTAGCYPLTALDFKIKSPYNTYLYNGLPPGPIGNPGISAITAAMNPASSPYWYYLSDPKTGKTIYAKTLDEQNANRAKYLGG